MRLRIFLTLILALPVLAGAQTNLPIDPEAATEAYLASVSDADRERSDAYFEGGYWLQLIGFVYGLGVAWILLASRLSARNARLGRKTTRAGFSRQHSLSPAIFCRQLRDQLSALVLSGVRPRAPIRPRDTNIRSVDARSARRPRRWLPDGRPRDRRALCRDPQDGATVVDLRNRWRRRLPFVHDAHRPGFHHTALQYVHSSRRPGRERPDLEHGPRERCPRRPTSINSMRHASRTGSALTSAASFRRCASR